MFNQFFPRSIDNTYRGRKHALWFFTVVVFVKMLQSLLVIFGGDSVVSSADGIPLDTFAPTAAQTIVGVWAQLGLYRLSIYLLCVLVLVRYRSAVPFMYALLIIQYLVGQLIFEFVPIVRVGAPLGPVVNLTLFALMIVGLTLSLWSRSNSPIKES